MNRQKVTITIAKINRIAKQIAYWSELQQPINLDHFDPGINQIDLWGKEVLEFMRDCNSTELAKMVLKGCKPELLQVYLNTMDKILPKETYSAFVRLSKILPELHEICKQIMFDYQEEYSILPERLANDKAIKYLERAVDAEYLDVGLQPTPNTNQPQLKLIAYAVSKIMNFGNRYRYVYFNQLWKRIGYDLASIRFPRYKDCHIQDIIDLYPEVDFSPLFEEPQNLSLKTKYDNIKLTNLYHDLKDFGYISIKTSEKVFLGIFEGHKFIEPVCWIREQVLLGYLIKKAFGEDNKFNLWTKTSSCFLIKGERPHPASITTSLYRIKLEGRMKMMCKELDIICDKLNNQQKVDCNYNNNPKNKCL